MGEEVHVLKAKLGVIIVIVLAFGALAAGADAKNGTATTQFRASYTQLEMSFTCSGVHQIKKASVADSETCLVAGDGTSNLVAGTYSSNETVFIDGLGMCGIISPAEPGFGDPETWVSDFTGVCAASFTSTWRMNTDGSWTNTIKAIY